MYQQRPLRVVPDSAPADVGYWLPAPLSEDAGLQAEDLDRITGVVEDDRYVVIDDIMYGTVTLAVCPWPRRNSIGDLVFQPSSELIVPEDLLHEAISSSRNRSGQDAPDRALRVSDAFHVRGIKTDELPEEPQPRNFEEDAIRQLKDLWRSRWVDVLPRWRIVDVTADARDAAKVALYSAVAPALTNVEAERFAPSDDELPPSAPPPGPHAQPAV